MRLFFVVRFCSHRKTSNRVIFFRYSAIEYARTTRFSKIKDKLGVSCLFEQKHNIWIFPKEYLMQPILTADPMLAPLLKAQCKKILIN